MSEKASKGTFDKSKIYVFKLLEGRNLHLGDECLTLDSDGITPVKLRYIPRFESPFEADQPPMDEGMLARMPRDPIIFTDTEKRVTSKNLYEFLINHDEFQGKKHRLSKQSPRFYLVNPDAILVAEEAQMDKQALAVESIKKATDQHRREIAIGMFGSNPNDSNDKIRVDMMKLAQAKPDAILKAMQSSAPKRKYEIRMGFSKGILSESNGEVKWTGSGVLITTIPKSSWSKKEDFLADFCLKEGKEFHKLLQAELDK